MRSIIMTADGYRQAIELLEERFGGLDSLLMSRQEALLALPDVREGDFIVIEFMQGRLGTFLLEWASLGQGVLDETESKAFFSILMKKF